METENVTELESITKEAEKTLYPEKDVEPEVKAEEPEAKEEVVSEDPKKDEVAEPKPEDKVEEEKVETEDDKEVEYKLELKEDSLLDNSIIAESETYAKENNLSNDMAQMVLSKQEEILEKYVANEEASIQAELQEWRQSVVDDKVMGGENLAQTAEYAKRAAKAFGGDELNELLIDTGYGDHPVIVRALSKIGSLMKEDSLILPGAEAGGPKPMEDLFYTN